MLAVTGQKQRTTGERIYHGLAVNKMLPRSKSGPVRRNEEKRTRKGLPRRPRTARWDGGLLELPSQHFYGQYRCLDTPA
ncbi:hypothetical protein M404DRAFT_181322 [Pisolithus tinctorius Marx 270]|uniref:Uncharacterized protein n=1 Tax=Pisolithus tinctorius Marx 270 TaxID=870435 RepID=A0A0C3KYT5_PISTI|nr:hypothetical protein M404DRAFT_181322 [Pisolithus tinctorius Marx 270]